MKRVLLFACSLLVLLMADRQKTGDPCDLLEAYHIANTEAIKWNRSARPYFITSVDDPLQSELTKGADGRRSCWNFDFAVEGTNKHLIITLHNRTVVRMIEADSVVDPDYIINMRDYCISTADAVAFAKESCGLLPGTDWAQGYHFVLETNGSVLTLSVVGRDKDGHILRILFDAKTARLLVDPYWCISVPLLD